MIKMRRSTPQWTFSWRLSVEGSRICDCCSFYCYFSCNTTQVMQSGGKKLLTPEASTFEESQHDANETDSNETNVASKLPYNEKCVKKQQDGIQTSLDNSIENIDCEFHSSKKECGARGDFNSSVPDNSKCIDLHNHSTVCSEASVHEITKKNDDENAEHQEILTTEKREEKNTDSDTDSIPSTEEKKSKQSNVNSKYDPTPNTPKPVHKWAALTSMLNRQHGSSTNYSSDYFRYRCYGSLHMVERLELMYKMKKHDGCVNALNFNHRGTRLASASDDLSIIIWDWTLSEPVIEYESGHKSNVFQAKFMPFSGDCHVVSCARDGQVRIGELSSEGLCRASRKVAQHKGAVHKLAVRLDSPHTFLSCGEDAVVLQIDLRKEKAERLSVCKEGEKKVSLYSVFINPNKTYEYVVGGQCQFVSVYDSRFLSQDNGFLKKYCPLHLVNNELKTNVTSVTYNYNGEEILASYNDEDIYCFNLKETNTSAYLHRYRGHRNSQTVKSVNYFGPKSEYVTSGSDCGYIFFWDKESEHIVKYMYGDESGVVNCLEPNPNMPVLASSGLDDDIKIWVPSCEELPDLSGLKNHIISNVKERDEDRKTDRTRQHEEQMIFFLMQHLRRTRRNGNSNATESSTSSDSDEEDEQSGMQCNQS